MSAGVPIGSCDSVKSDRNFSSAEREVGLRLGEHECERGAADRDYEKRRASRNKPVNEQSAVK